jgi:hypothetical protein
MSLLRHELVWIRAALPTCQDGLVLITSGKKKTGMTHLKGKTFFLNCREHGDSKPFRNVGKNIAINTD